MDMKRILQAFDGASTKPVEGASDMSRFLRVVAEADLNQPEVQVNETPADPKQQAESYIRYSSGLYDVSKLPPNITIRPGVVLPISVNPLPQGAGMDKAIKANITAANARLPKDLQLAPDALSALVGGADQPYAGPTLTEGANPHKVALPVQMAMQHYQQPKAVVPAKESLFKKYFIEAEEQLVQKETERKQLIKQYASVIAERVRLKESSQQAGVVPVAETPIEMTAEPNDPVVHSHEKANPMSLKGRIHQARAQLQELAQMAQSDDLLVWQKICELSKGGMFMGLEQNIEQVRHGIQELAKQRKKGGIASRGIDKNISE